LANILKVYTEMIADAPVINKPSVILHFKQPIDDEPSAVIMQRNWKKYEIC